MKSIYPTFSRAISDSLSDLKQFGKLIHPNKWQSIDTSKKPEAKTYELFNHQLSVIAIGYTLERLREEIKPNLPWADDHFEERVAGQPVNPGNTWDKWPWALKADSFRDSKGQFNHNYMERYWPKYAGPHGVNTKWNARVLNHGIRYTYGDLNDVVDQIASDPTTRQAYLPVFFPEDTGAVHKGRVPCSLGYHFFPRDNYLHLNYYLRSCEAYRHFRDDIYLTVRLQLWMIDRLKEKGINLLPGIFTMYMTSFHCFINDKEKL